MINKERLYKIREEYLRIKETNPEKAAIYLLKNTKNILKLALYGMNIRKELADEARSFIEVDIIRAFDTYDQNKNASIWTWIYRIIVQSQYKFVQMKTSQNKKTAFDFSYETTPEVYDVPVDNLNPEDRTIYNESSSKYFKNLNMILDNVLKGSLEKEIYCRMNGCLGYRKQTIEEIINDTRLSEKTVLYLKKKNLNSFYFFKKYLKNNNLNLSNITFNDIYKFKNNSK